MSRARRETFVTDKERQNILVKQLLQAGELTGRENTCAIRQAERTESDS